MSFVFRYSQYIAFGLMIAGLWISFRHQLGIPDNRASTSYIGELGNPFALKEKYLQTYLIYPGILLAVLGGILTIWTSLSPSGLERPDPVLGALTAFLVLLAFGIGAQKITTHIARRAYMPLLLKHQRELFEREKFVLENSGVYPGEHSIPESTRKQRIESAKQSIDNMSEIFELDSSSSFADRFEKIKRMYGH